MKPLKIGLALVFMIFIGGGVIYATPLQAISAPVLKWRDGGCYALPYCNRGWYGSPAVVDLDGDQKLEIVWELERIFALNAADGKEKWHTASGARAWPGIAVADLTGNGSLEIIVGRGGNLLQVYNAAGQLQWERNPFANGEIRTLAVTDLETDGQLEIVVGRASSGEGLQVSVYEPDGSVRSGWPARRAGELGYGTGLYNENVTIADYDNDGFKELIVPNDTHYILAFDRNGNQLKANAMYGANKYWSQVGVHVDHAVDLKGFAECGTEHRPNFANSAPATADVNGDGQLEIIVVGDVYDCAIGDPEGDLYQLPYIFNIDRTRWKGSGYDWTAIPAPAPNSGPTTQDFDVIETAEMNAVVADLDNDGFKEILYPSYDGRLHVYWLDKTQHGNWPYKVPGTGFHFASEPIVVDWDNDGKAEVIFTSWPQKGSNEWGRLHILDYLGNELHNIELPKPQQTGRTWNGGLGAPTIANIDDDADMELIVATAYAGIAAYDLPNSAKARVLWGTGRGSLARTGVAPTSNNQQPTATPATQATATHTPVASFTPTSTSVANPTATPSPTVPSTSIGGCPVFPADNVWNTPIDTLPVDANSAAYINSIGATETLHPDFGSGTWEGAPIGIPYVVVPQTQPLVAITSFLYGDESDPGPYPIPTAAPIEGGANGTGDRHVLVIQQGACKLYELYRAFPASDGTWKGDSGAVFELQTHKLRPDTWTSADAAGLPIFPGLARYEEVAAGQINHALRFTVNRTRRAYVWPARHYASSSTEATLPPMGQRFRLKASFDISGFSRDTQIILTALKKYGLILADNGSDWYISGAPNENWDNDILSELSRVAGSHFEAVDTSSLMVDPNSGQSRSSASSKKAYLPVIRR